MPKTIDAKKLFDAAAALERAAGAASRAVQYPRSHHFPDPIQIAAVEAEVRCAVALIEEAGRDA